MRVLHGKVGVFGSLLLPSPEYHQLYAPFNKHTLSIEAVGHGEPFDSSYFGEDDSELVSLAQEHITEATAAVVVLTGVSWNISEVELNLFTLRKKSRSNHSPNPGESRRYNPLKLPNVVVVTQPFEGDYQIGYVPDQWFELCSQRTFDYKICQLIVFSERKTRVEDARLWKKSHRKVDFMSFSPQFFAQSLSASGIHRNRLWTAGVHISWFNFSPSNIQTRLWATLYPPKVPPCTLKAAHSIENLNCLILSAQLPRKMIRSLIWNPWSI
jgi:hypothetical protein